MFKFSKKKDTRQIKALINLQDSPLFPQPKLRFS